MKYKGKKRWINSPGVRRALGQPLGAVLRLLENTGRWKLEIDERSRALLAAGQPLLGAYPHGRLMMIPALWHAMVEAAGLPKDTPSYTLSSWHPDGETVSTAIGPLGVRSIRGASRRGGVEAFIEMRRVVRDGFTVAIAIDGPRGPRLRVHPGIMQLARHTGAPVVPATYSAGWAQSFNSWDRFMLPAPYTPGLLCVGTPHFVPTEADADELEQARLAVERELIELTQAADRHFGRVPVEPAPPR